MPRSKRLLREISRSEKLAPSDLTLWSEYLDRKFLTKEIALDLDDASTISESCYGDVPLERPMLSLTWGKSKDNPQNWPKWKKAFHTFVPSQ